MIISFSLLRPLDGGLIVFQTLLKMERIGKGWGAHLVGGYLCAQPRLPVLSLSIVIVLLFNIYVYHK